MQPVFTDTQNLVKYLTGLRSTQVATIVAITSVKMNKRGNPYFAGGVRKVQSIKVTVNDNYENKVNDTREAEGKSADFEVAPLQWGEHVANGKGESSCVIEHNGQLYVQTLVVERDPRPVYIDAAGNKVDYDQIRPFLPPYNPATRQQLDDEIKVRTWKLRSLYAVYMGDKLIYKDTETVGPQQGA